MGWKKNVMDQDKKAGLVLEQLRIPTQVKLAGLWATVMFMDIYVGSKARRSRRAVACTSCSAITS